jgi:hypothetical protein
MSSSNVPNSLIMRNHKIHTYMHAYIHIQNTSPSWMPWNELLHSLEYLMDPNLSSALSMFYLCVCVYICIYILMDPNLSSALSMFYLYVCVYICIYILMDPNLSSALSMFHLFVCVCVYIYIYIYSFPCTHARYVLNASWT